MKRLFGGALRTHIKQGDIVYRHPRKMYGQADIVDSLTPCEEFSVYMALQGEHAPSVLHLKKDIIFLKYEQGECFNYNNLNTVCLSYLSYYIQRIHSLRLPVPYLDTTQRLYTYRNMLQHKHMLSQPLKKAIDWLLTHIPNFTPVSLHGDYKCDNVFDTGIVLDWEFAHMGDYHEDIAWFLSDMWHHGTLSTAQYHYFLSEYERRTHKSICPHRLRYWTIFAYVRFATIACQQYNRSKHEGCLDLHMTGWRVHTISHILAQKYHMAPYTYTPKTQKYPSVSEAIYCFYKNILRACIGTASGKNLYNHTKKAILCYTNGKKD